MTARQISNNGPHEVITSLHVDNDSTNIEQMDDPVLNLTSASTTTTSVAKCQRPVQLWPCKLRRLPIHSHSNSHSHSYSNSPSLSLNLASPHNQHQPQLQMSPNTTTPSGACRVSPLGQPHQLAQRVAQRRTRHSSPTFSLDTPQTGSTSPRNRHSPISQSISGPTGLIVNSTCQLEAPSIPMANNDRRRDINSINAQSTQAAPTTDGASLIVDHLYVGEQLDTSVERLCALNINYLLSFQTLPLFLDQQQQQTESAAITKEHSGEKKKKEQPQQVNVVIGNQRVECKQAEHCIRERLSQSNSSLDYVIQLSMDNDDDNDESTNLNSSSDSNTECSKTKSKSKSNCDDFNSDCNQLNLDLSKLNQIKPNSNSSLSESQKDHQSNVESSQINSKTKRREIRAKCVNVSDTHDQRLDTHFDECLAFIDEAIDNKCNILIHCKAGVSRSPSIAIAYLMRSNRHSLTSAYHHVKCRRSQISPNLNFMGQLYAYEQQLALIDLSSAGLTTPIGSSTITPATSTSISTPISSSNISTCIISTSPTTSVVNSTSITADQSHRVTSHLTSSSPASTPTLAS